MAAPQKGVRGSNHLNLHAYVRLPQWLHLRVAVAGATDEFEPEWGGQFCSTRTCCASKMYQPRDKNQPAQTVSPITIVVTIRCI